MSGREFLINQRHEERHRSAVQEDELRRPRPAAGPSACPRAGPSGLLTGGEHVVYVAPAAAQAGPSAEAPVDYEEVQQEEHWSAAEWEAWQDWGAPTLQHHHKTWRPRGCRGGDWLRRAWRAGLPTEQMRQLVKYRAAQSAMCDRRHGYWQDYTGCKY